MTDIADQSDHTEPVESGELGEGVQQTAEVEPSPEPWAEFDNYADQLAQVLVDGEPQLVPLAELRDGYQRQADYTRKTQALAEERAAHERAVQLYQALDADPAGTLKLLQTAFAEELAPEVPDPEDEFLTDEQKQIKALEAKVNSFVQEQEMSHVAQQLDNELNGLVSQYGLDEVGKQALIDFAVGRDYDNFTDAFARMQLEGAIAKNETAAQVQARQEAARAAQVVSAGTQRNSAAQPSIQPKAGQSVRDSYEQAKAMLAAQ